MEIQKKRGLPVVFYVLDSKIGLVIGLVPGNFYPLRSIAIVERFCVVVTDIGGRPVIETLASWTGRGKSLTVRAIQVPFSDAAGRVSVVFQHFGAACFTDRQLPTRRAPSRIDWLAEVDDAFGFRVKPEETTPALMRVFAMEMRVCSTAVGSKGICTDRSRSLSLSTSYLKIRFGQYVP